MTQSQLLKLFTYEINLYLTYIKMTTMTQEKAVYIQGRYHFVVKLPHSVLSKVYFKFNESYVFTQSVKAI